MLCNLTNTPQTANISANCIRSLLLQPSPTPADVSIARYLFPRLVAFVTNADQEDPEAARSLVAHALCQYVSVVDKPKVATAMALVVPTLVARAANEGEGDNDVYAETSGRLLELAAADQVAFRAVVAGMSDVQKAFLEDVIRSGQRAAGRRAGRDVADTSGQPTIELKMDFGG